MSLTEEWIVSRVKLLFVGSFILIVLLGVSNIWLFTTLTSLQADKNTLTSQVNDSQTQLTQKNKQIQTLQSQLLTLQNHVENLSSQINTLNQT
jgi:peptidoglycan hydrolase CwlO-like protein